MKGGRPRIEKVSHQTTFMYIVLSSLQLSEQNGTRGIVIREHVESSASQGNRKTSEPDEDSLWDNGKTLLPPATIDASGPRLDSMTAAGSNH
jgi:hypothetical protein